MHDTKFKTTVRIILGTQSTQHIWLFISILVGLGLIVLDLFVQQGIYSAFAFPILYNAMDLIGFRNIYKDGIEELTNSQGILRTNHYRIQILQAYRILQHTIEFLLALSIGLLVGWEWMLVGLFIKFTSSSDILYHWIGGYEKFPKHWHYQGWTIIGWFWTKRDSRGFKAIPSSVIYCQFFTGMTLALTYYFWWS